MAHGWLHIKLQTDCDVGTDCVGRGTEGGGKNTDTNTELKDETGAGTLKKAKFPKPE